MSDKTYSDIIPHDQVPSFDDLVAIIEKNFKAVELQNGEYTVEEVEHNWQRYKVLNHLYEDKIKWGSKELIGRSWERFKELIYKQWDWRSFYNGWIEGRADMLAQIKGWEQYKENNKTNNNENF